MAVTPFQLKYKLILNSGLAKIADLLANLQTLSVTKFEIGSDVNYTPSVTQTGVNTLVFSDQDPLSPGNFLLNTIRISDTKVQIDLLLNNNIGDFQIGEMVLKFSDGTPFLIGVLDNAFSKLKDPGGNAFQVSLSINILNSDVVQITSTITVFNSLSVVDEEADLPLITDFSTNAFIINNYNTSGAWALAYKDAINSQWRFISQIQGIVNEDEVLVATNNKNSKSSGKKISSSSDYTTSFELIKIPDKQSIKDYSEGTYIKQSGGNASGFITKTGSLKPLNTGDLTPKDFVDLRSNGLKNAIINGDFRFWQRGNSFVLNPNDGRYICDRWINNSAGTGGTRTISRQNFAAGELEGIGLYSPNYLKLNQSVAQSPQTQNQLVQRIEDIRTLAGREVTLSFYAKAASSMIVSVGASQQTGAGGSGTPIVIPSQNITIGTTWQRYTWTFTFGSLAGLTIGTSSYSAITFDFPLAVIFNFDLAYVQLEHGSTPSYYDYRCSKIELELCQRYYEKTYELDTAPGTVINYVGCLSCMGDGNGIANVQGDYFYNTPKRVVPTPIFYNPETGATGTMRRANAVDVEVGALNAGIKRLTWNNTATSGNSPIRHDVHCVLDAEL